MAPGVLWRLPEPSVELLGMVADDKHLEPRNSVGKDLSPF